jgi:hypothetical protein
MGDEHNGEPLLPLDHDVPEKVAYGNPDTPKPGPYPVGDLFLDLLVLGDRQVVFLPSIRDGLIQIVYEIPRNVTIAKLFCQIEAMRTTPEDG